MKNGLAPLALIFSVIGSIILDAETFPFGRRKLDSKRTPTTNASSDKGDCFAKVKSLVRQSF